MLVFLVMGYLSPNFNKSAKDAEALLRRWTPVSVILLFVISALGACAVWYLFALYCIAAWPLSVTHPLVGQRSRPDEAGRAIAFFNLLLFVGVFLWQWSFGAVVTIHAPTVGVESAYQMAMAALGVLICCGLCRILLVIPEVNAERIGQTCSKQIGSSDLGTGNKVSWQVKCS